MAAPPDRYRIENDRYAIDLRVTPRTPRGPRPLLLTLVSVAEQDATYPGARRRLGITGRDLSMPQLKDNEQVLLTVAENDVYGNPVPDEKRGQLSAVSSDESAVTVAPVDGQSGSFLVKASPGADSVSAAVTISDNTDDDAEAEFQGSAAFDVVDHRRGEVAELVVQVGTPEAQPTEPTA